MRISGIKPAKSKNLDSIPNVNYLLCDMYENRKLSLNEISKELGIGPLKIKNKLIELGITIRSRKESYNLKMEETYGARD